MKSIFESIKLEG